MLVVAPGQNRGTHIAPVRPAFTAFLPLRCISLIVGFPDHPQEISICRTKGRNHRGNKSPTSTFSPNLGSFSSGAAFFPLRPFIFLF